MKEFFKGYCELIVGLISAAAFAAVCILMLYHMRLYDEELSFSELKGRGLENDPYIISDAADYVFFAGQLDSYGSEYADCYVNLSADIELSGEDSGRVIGNEGKGTFFAGVFDGCGHSISGLSYEGDYAGLFPKLMGTVRNLVIKDAHMKGKHAAGIAGQVEAGGSIINCSCDGSFEGDGAADIASVCFGRIENCVTNSPSPAVFKEAAGSSLDSVYETAGGDRGRIAESMNDYIDTLLPECSYNSWKYDESGVYMDGACRLTARVLNVHTFAGGRPVDIKGFFSFPERKWFVVLPSGCRDEDMTITVTDSEGRVTATDMTPDDPRFYVGDRLCEAEFLFYDDIPTIFVDFYDDNELSYLYRSKDLYETCSLLALDSHGSRDISISGVLFSGRGNDSYMALKKGYSIELPLEYSIAGMESTLGYNLLPCYRDNCYLTYMYTRDLYRGLKLDYAHEYRPVNLFINGRFLGLYFLTEKMTISRTAFDLENLAENTKRMNGLRLYEYPRIQEGGKDHNATRVYYDLPHVPEDVTGGYIMEVTMLDYALTDSRFRTKRGVMISSKADKYLGKAQLDYIEQLFTDYEDAVTSPDGYNEKGVYYGDYIDMESFADQWILFEVAADLANDNSVYFYKDSDRRGDGKIHAIWYWDAEHALTEEKRLKEHFLMRRVEKGADCTYNKINTGNFWTWIYRHEDFRQMLAGQWREKFYPAFKASLSDELTDNSGGAGTFAWYETQYTDSFKINDRCWYNTDYLGKCRELAERLETRVDFLNDYFK